jgi:predicted MFS family arabinose efflux permease
LSFGGILIAPAVALMISRLGLSGAAPFMGLAYFLGIVPVTILVLRPSPAALGLAPDGAAPLPSIESAPQPAVSYADAWRSRYFYAVSIAYLFLLGAQVGAIAHLYRLASVRDGVATAALAIATMATSSTIGRLAGGGLMLWVSVRSFALALMAMQAVALALLAFAADRMTILAGASLFGLTMGNSLMMHPLLLAERFGTRDYGRIYSMSQLVTMIGVAGCPALIGVMYETSGDYQIPFLAVCGATLVGFVVLSMFADRRR